MKSLIGLSIALFLTGCASTFKPIPRESLDYQKTGEGSDVEIDYNHGVLAESRNVTYDTKARMNGVDIVAVRIKNNTDRPINPRQHLDFYVGGVQANPANAKTALHSVRQRTGFYFLYLLMLPVNVFKTETKCSGYRCEQDTSIFPIGLIAGLLATGINAGISASANASFEKEITANDLVAKTIEPGQSASGYLVFRDIGSAPLTARLKGRSLPMPPASAPPVVSDPDLDRAPSDPSDFR